MVSRYCFVSLPLQERSPVATWSSLRQGVSKIAFDIPAHKIQIPDLQIGTLDSLLALGDDLSKYISTVEAISHKLRQQIEELEHHSGTENHLSSLTVDGIPIDSFITRFAWDEDKYPIASPLRHTVEKIQATVEEIEDDFLVRTAEYNTVHTQVNARSRKQAGNVATRDLSLILHKDDIIDSEHLRTLLVVVGSHCEEDWCASYEKLSPLVVPRSARKVVEENDSSLFSVVVFKSEVEKFKAAARQKGYQIREFDCDADQKAQKEEDAKHLLEESVTLRSSLLEWCLKGYDEAVHAWMHIIVIRIFVESVLRYGLPPAFLAAVIAPNLKHEKKVRMMLENMPNVKGRDTSFWKGDEDVTGMAGIIGGDGDVHPYVSFVMNLK